MFASESSPSSPGGHGLVHTLGPKLTLWKCTAKTLMELGREGHRKGPLP